MALCSHACLNSLSSLIIVTSAWPLDAVRRLSSVGVAMTVNDSSSSYRSSFLMEILVHLSVSVGENVISMAVRGS